MHNLPNWTIDILSVMLWVVPALLVLAAVCLWITGRDAKRTMDERDAENFRQWYRKTKRPPVNR